MINISDVLHQNDLSYVLNGIRRLSQLDNRKDIDRNLLLIEIVKSKRYHLLRDYDYHLNVNNKETFDELIKFIFSDMDNILYYLSSNGFSFNEDEKERFFQIIIENKNNKYLEIFFDHLSLDGEFIERIVKKNEDYFRNYLRADNNSSNILYQLQTSKSQTFIKLILEEGKFDLISDMENYSVSNLKLLIKVIKDKYKIPYYRLGKNFMEYILSIKENFDANEFCELLSLYSTIKWDKDRYETLFLENIDYLIDIVSKTKVIPICLLFSTEFRDECIKRKRYDLVVQCLIPENIMDNDELINAYCKEFNIDYKDFYQYLKWLYDYYKKNNNIFNTMLGSFLKKDLFTINKEHYERFINDTEIQNDILKMNNKELKVFSKILDMYDYKDYDVSFMIVNIIKNIKDYSELINSLNIDSLTEKDIKLIVRVLQLSGNEFNIKNLYDLHNYDIIKKEYFDNNFKTSNLENNQAKLLKVLFNIDLKEGKFINSKFCYDFRSNNNILNDLKNSELPKDVYSILSLINKIVEAKELSDLEYLYRELKDTVIYNKEIPLETYLKSRYAELYNNTLYQIDEKNAVYGPKDNVMKQVSYNGKNVQICVPKEYFYFLIHCVGTCSLESDVIDSNYCHDWLDRPQLQDHFVACSYITEKNIYSIRSDDKVIYGFDSLENGSILGMSEVDVDSYGNSLNYNGSRMAQEDGRARYYVPSMMIKKTGDSGYNEIVVERRNTDKKKKDFKRKPDYIIMISESMEKDNFYTMEDLFMKYLSFISLEDRKMIKKTNAKEDIIKILNKYEEEILKSANDKNISLKNMKNIYIILIMKSRNYENSLKAASEFDIPLVIIDRTYYFNKMLNDSSFYDDETKDNISRVYFSSNGYIRKMIFDAIAYGKDVMELLKNLDKYTLMSNDFLIEHYLHEKKNAK